MSYSPGSVVRYINLRQLSSCPVEARTRVQIPARALNRAEWQKNVSFDCRSGNKTKHRPKILGLQMQNLGVNGRKPLGR